MEKWRKKNYFIKFITINNVYYSLSNINSNIFCFQDDIYNIKFYDTHSYECNKAINYNREVKHIGVIKGEII